MRADLLRIRVTLVAAAIAYQSWTLAGVVGHRVDWFDSYVSELAALNQPNSSLYRFGDLVTGVLLIAAVVLLIRRGLAPRRRLIGWLAVAAFGLATIADAIWPMSCATSLEPACDRVGGRQSATDIGHQIASLVTVVALALACICLSWGLGRARRWLRVVAGLYLGFSIVTGIEGYLDSVHAQYAGVLGFVQRAMVLCAALWWVLAGFAEPVGARSVDHTPTG